MLIIKYIVLGFLIFLCLITYLTAYNHPKAHMFIKAPEKFFVKNKKILKYFRNPKFGVAKVFAVDHFAQVLSLVSLLPFYVLYWINGSTAFFLDNLPVFVLVVFCLSIFPMLISTLIFGRMQRFF